MMYLNDIARLFENTLPEHDLEIVGVSTDTRTISPGDLFVALIGENFDAHNYLTQAAEKGAVAALVMTQPKDAAGLPLIAVKDTRLALGELATYWRQQQSIKVVGLTGSNGKTTVKEMLTSILSTVGTTTATVGNLNNDIGVPLTLLKIRPEHEFAVIEMGANHAGEIAYLTQLTKPDVAILNNAGPAHLEGFGSLQGVAEAKGEIFSGLPATGVAIINVDDVYADYWISLCDDHRKIFFGLDASANVSAAVDVESYDGNFELLVDEMAIDVCLNVLGVHNLKNALAASAAATALGVDLQHIKQGLENFAGVNGRLQVLRAANDSMIINDSYNANPASMRAAIDVLALQKAPTLLIIGDMAELGDDGDTLHAGIGEYAKEKNITTLLAFGPMSKHAAVSFGKEGRAYEDKESLIRDARAQLENRQSVLVKGSRSMKMEEVVDALVDENNPGAA